MQINVVAMAKQYIANKHYDAVNTQQFLGYDATVYTGKFISSSHFNLLLQRDAMLARYILWHCVCLSVRLCLCLSITSRRCTKTARDSIKQTKPHDSPEESCFLAPKILAKFDRDHPQRGRQLQVW